MKRFLAILGVVLLGLVLWGCPEKEGPMESMGEQMDEAMDEMGDAAEEVGDEMRDAAREAGDAVEDAVDKVDGN